MVITGDTPGATLEWPYLRGFKTNSSIPLPPRRKRSAVAAETPYQAWDAIKAIKVRYEFFPFLVDEQKAL